MVRILALFSLIYSAGCETIVQDAHATRAIYSEAGGFFSWFTGKVSSCTLVESVENPPRVAFLTFDGKCKVEVESGGR